MTQWCPHLDKKSFQLEHVKMILIMREKMNYCKNILCTHLLQFILLAFRAGFFKSLMDRYMTDNVYNPYFTTVSQQGSDFELLFIKEGNFCQIEKPLLNLNELKLLAHKCSEIQITDK